VKRHFLFRNPSDTTKVREFIVDPALADWRIKLHKIPDEPHVLPRAAALGSVAPRLTTLFATYRRGHEFGVLTDETT
jgi:hypothetical protein